MATARKRKRSTAVNMHLPFIVYIRVSRIGGRSAIDGYISKQLQLAACERVAQLHNVTILAVFREENVSGTSTARPKFQEALQLVRDGKAGGIIVMTLDRFSRDTADGLALIKDIEAHGGSVFTEEGPASCRTSDAELQTTAKLMVATREVGGKREQWARSTENAVGKNGRHLQIPYGYMRGTWKGRERVLVAHPTEAPVVERIYLMRAAGTGWNTIAKTLNTEGILPRPFRRGLKDAEGDRIDEWETVQGVWRGDSVQAIVNSETYLGIAWNGDHRVPNAHQPLVTKKVWRDANEARGVKHSYRGGEHLLTGLVRCGTCGRAMVRTQRRGRSKTTRYSYYSCRDRSRGGTCTAPANVPADALEEHMHDAILDAARQIRHLQPVEDDSQLAVADSVLAAAEAEYVSALDRLDKAKAQKVKGAQLRAIESNADAKLAALTAAETARDEAAQVQHALTLPMPVGELLKQYGSLPVSEQRHLQAAMFAAVAVRPGRGLREPVEARVQVVRRGDVPGSIDLISFVAGLHWNEAVAGVRAA